MKASRSGRSFCTEFLRRQAIRVTSVVPWKRKRVRRRNRQNRDLAATDAIRPGAVPRLASTGVPRRAWIGEIAQAPCAHAKRQLRISCTPAADLHRADRCNPIRGMICKRRSRPGCCSCCSSPSTPRARPARPPRNHPRFCQLSARLDRRPDLLPTPAPVLLAPLPPTCSLSPHRRQLTDSPLYFSDRPDSIAWSGRPVLRAAQAQLLPGPALSAAAPAKSANALQAEWC